MEVYVDLEAVSICVILLWPYVSALRVVPCVSLVFSMSKLTALISRVFAALDAWFQLITETDMGSNQLVKRVEHAAAKKHEQLLSGV